MRRSLLLSAAILLIPAFCMAAKDPFIESVKEKAKSIIGDSKLFKVVKAEYDKRPEQAGGVNVYSLELKTTGKMGEGTLVFVKYPNPTSMDQKIQDIKPVYRNVTIKKAKYMDKVAKMEKVNNLALHLADDETLAVFLGQRLIITWLGDGYGVKGFHLYAYQERVAK